MSGRGGINDSQLSYLLANVSSENGGCNLLYKRVCFRLSASEWRLSGTGTGSTPTSTSETNGTDGQSVGRH